ncbi:MAG: hypothetical protein E7576_17435 [Ruminococcaceae bacterium]|nr:hypothetical protein [Oscillospiraceae bacterium]
MNIYELQATLTLDTGGFRQSVEEAGALFRSLGDSLGGSAEGLSERAADISGALTSVLSVLGGEGSELLLSAADGTAALFAPFDEELGARIGQAAGAFLSLGGALAEILAPTEAQAAAQNEVNAALNAGSEAVSKNAEAAGKLPESLGAAAESVRGWAREAGESWSSAAEAAISAGSGIAEVFAGRIPEAASAAVEAAASLPGAFSAIGSQMASGLESGFSSLWDSVVSAIGKKVSSLVGSVKGLLGIQSPSRVFADIGGNMARGLEIGWTEEFGAAEAAVLGSGGLGSFGRLALRRGILSDRLDFGDSAIGRSSAAGIASLTAADSGFGSFSGRAAPVEIRLILDGEVAAEALYDPLEEVGLRLGQSVRGQGGRSGRSGR